MIAVIVYHKNVNQYPSQWIEEFKASILNQTYQDFDILELNYGGGEERIFENSIFTSKEFVNHAEAMNYLFDQVGSYDYVFNTNIDDYYSKDRIAIQMQSDADIVSSNFVLLSNDKAYHVHRFENKDIFGELKRDHNIICHPVVRFSKRFILENRYAPEEIPFEDMLLWKRTISKYNFVVLPNILCFHRVHSNSVGHNEGSNQHHSDK